MAGLGVDNCEANLQCGRQSICRQAFIAYDANLTS